MPVPGRGLRRLGTGLCGLLKETEGGDPFFERRQKIHISALANGRGIQYNILIGAGLLRVAEERETGVRMWGVWKL